MKRTVTFLILLLMMGSLMAQGEFVCGDTGAMVMAMPTQQCR